MSAEEREAGRFVHSFSYGICLVVTPLLGLCQQGAKYDGIRGGNRSLGERVAGCEEYVPPR
ncbi:hypothetical protein BD311DRAFT_747426 [Dichomitus squalens]|uniref:Uncharacterized protein n=1 Tax=Dichomitus squalens TaxID=114155 RepID=A0A4Q9N300_9APHY|nr:hypothetical protein BD311DRAFT_747426 [Dichomitus squalens]